MATPKRRVRNWPFRPKRTKVRLFYLVVVREAADNASQYACPVSCRPIGTIKLQVETKRH